MQNEDKKMEVQSKKELQECQPCEVEAKRVVTQTYSPAVDVLERPDEVVVLADLPGVKTKDVDIEYEDGRLSFTAHAETAHRGNGKTLLREYETGDFRRSFRVGDAIDASKIRAEMNDGVLTLRLPKKATEVARKIPVQ